MGLFKSRYEKEMDEAIKKLEMNMSNNYKDAAQSNFKEFCDLYKTFKDEGKLKDKTAEAYAAKIKEYETKMQGYTHKDQKPYWT
ncbi:MAG: hypothetical protein J5840_01170 [Lachnospiraceae bacterium]|nr:hypothetical protein [Lachnospiraceae bacterium]